MTDLHLIYVTDCNDDDELKLVHAKDLKIGQCLHRLDGITSMESQRIVKLDKVSDNVYFLRKLVSLSSVRLNKHFENGRK